MKQLIALLSLLLALLITSCASTEGYLFTNIATTQSSPQRNQLQEDKRDTSALAIGNTTGILKRYPEAKRLTAATLSPPIPQAATFSEKVLPLGFKATTPGKIPVSKVAVSPKKLSKRYENFDKKIKFRPEEGKKPVNKFALIGFILALSGIGLFILAAATGFGTMALIALLASIGGLITSIIGLMKVNQNPDKYAGRGKAIAGIAISVGTLVLFVTLLLVALILIAFVNSFYDNLI